MPVTSKAELKNRLLASLPPDEFGELSDHLTPVLLQVGHIINEPGEQTTSVLFPNSGVVSLVAISPEGQRTEAGLVGREGFAPPAAVWSDRSPSRTQVQMVCSGYTIPRETLIGCIHHAPVLAQKLSLFAHAAMTQLTSTLLSNTVHQLDERLARFLLMCHDRSESDDLALTHEFMSLMLAVRRPSVTNALHVLEGNGFIRSDRGYVTICNRKALEDFARDAYGVPEAEYRRLLGPF